jgi:ferric-dicitrate binding protein FerR (iron transport regulator)
MTDRLERERRVSSAHIAAELRERPEGLDELTRARMERALVQAWRTRPAAHVPLPGRARTERPARLATWAGSLAVAAAAGAVVAYFGTSLGSLGGRADIAQFELRIGEAAVQRGSIVEGQVLESGELGDIEVDLGSARVLLGRGARVRFDRLSETELRLSLSSGRIDVDFHPARKGEQQLVIESRAARVRVVGTRFSVETDAVGNTEVTVREGVVEVTPQVGGPSERVIAGGRTYVRADEGDAYERAVRAAIEAQLETLAPDEAEFGADGVMEFEADEVPSEEPESAKLSSEAAAKKLDQARALLRDGRHPAARGKLRGLLAERGAPQRVRVEALTLIAESHTAQGDMRRAVESYQQAAAIGVRTPSGDNAQFALARLLERFTHDRDAAADAYSRYLERAPNGALAAQARAAFCRLRPEHALCSP